MNDMSAAIVPKSDQLNSDDLISGPITIRISEVTIRAGQEQPVSLHYVGDNGKPYKPCKSMSRVLVFAWGPDASLYKDRSLTLYRDPSVKWGGQDVGGIRISHMSDIPEPLTMALTATKGSRKPFRVLPLVVEAETDWKAAIEAVQTVKELGELWERIPASKAKTALAGLKDSRKIALTAAQSTEV